MTRDTTTRALFRAMLRIRRCEEELLKAYHPADLMRCPMHFCIGQEAAPGALSLLLEPTDLVFSHHRNHGYFLAKGGTMRRLFAEMHGKDTGSNRGLAGSQDISESEIGFYSGAIVSGAVAIAVGAALAKERRRDPGIVVTAFGDGAMDQGVMWECFNLAALKRLPVLFLCENNNFSTYSPVTARHAVPDFVRKVEAFGVAAERLVTDDGASFLSRMTRAANAVRTARRPVFVEVETYRFCPHVGPEPDDYNGYRAPGEVEGRLQRDPLERLRGELVPSIVPARELAALESAIAEEIRDAFAFAHESPFPSPSLMYEALMHRHDGGTAGGGRPPGSAFDSSQPDAKLTPY